MADKGEAPRLSRQDKGKAKVGEPSDLASGDDQSEKKEPGLDLNEALEEVHEPKKLNYKPPPGATGSLPKDAMCLSLVLTSQEVDEAHPTLYLSSDEAFLLTDRAETIANPPRRFAEILVMTDRFDNQYRMKISNQSASPRRFLVNSEWSKFVYYNKLKEGDELWFFRFLDPVSMQPCYALRYFKNPGNVIPSSGRNLRCPGPLNSGRNLPCPEPLTSVAPGDLAASLEEVHSVLTKDLTLQDADPLNPDLCLYIDASDAYELTNCDKFLHPTIIPSPMMLAVFDDKDRLYNMLLSFCSTDRYTISQDWKRFVRVHKLKAGDRMIFFRYPVGEDADAFYELNYIRQDISKLTEPLKLPDRKRKPVPASRGIADPVAKLTKELSAHQGNILKLCLDINETWLLTGCDRVFHKYPCGTLLMNLLVYDEGEKPYDMVLTHLKLGDGKIICTLDGGWHRFVETHSLKAGDKVTISRFHGKTYYVLRYTRAGLPTGSRASGPK